MTLTAAKASKCRTADRFMQCVYKNMGQKVR